MKIRLNGEPKEIATGSTLADLVTELGLRPEQVAVELNRELVRRDRRTEVVIQADDEIELVTLVGGG